ncbi:hypothetical protein BTO06_11595 [Tenacibaculum sp. SZ-18]|uniref:T9SS type A sorting domain-containing protein n=1 Tax=Tenacibaculum sp. SZ-18 TaxID=754423 RepID=UPI000CA2903C|nr:T9SS type A sorting domain-containing protein [Tenacibaculum sp. SZ-18]AUC15753.1 hypothetical protein BTO06_11595 [Tenacibaculum sp. SZ-18]
MFSQTTEDFEDESNASTTFTSNGQIFSISSSENFDINAACCGLGWNGTSGDNKTIDNDGFTSFGGGTSLTIKTNDNTDFTLKSFYVYISDIFGNGPSCSLTVQAKKDGSNVFNFTKSSGFETINLGVNNGFVFIDLSTEGGSDNSNTLLDEIIITTDGQGDYLALDAFRWDVASACTDPDIPAVTATTPSICNGGNTNLIVSNSSSLNDATNWHIYKGSCGGTLIGTTATGVFNVSPNVTTTYYIRGEGGCVTPGSCGAVTVNVGNSANPGFAYNAGAYCNNEPDPSPIFIATPGGTFSSTNGLVITPNGTIDVSASTPGTYPITYTTAGACPTSTSTNITINALDNASFSYSSTAYCLNDPDPSPNSIATPGGTFSSINGLVIASNGTIDVSASTPGTYPITYTTAGTCPNSAIANITINALDDPSFSYSSTAYCLNDPDPSPNSIATPGGTFSSTNGLVIASNGTIDVSASTPGTYPVTYTTNGTCPNSAFANITINPADDASFSYPASAYCVSDSDPSPNSIATPGGTFSSTSGLVIAVNGTIDVSASTPGTYLITYTTNGTCPDSASANITINALDDASFSYGASSYTTEDADPSPTITGLTGGSFSAAVGLNINASTGLIDVSASTPGSYTVNYTTNGTCPNSSTFNIDIYPNTYTWTGNSDNNWNNTANWDNNIVPHSDGNVIIPNGLTNYPTATSVITVNSITMNDGASFIAQASVNGAITYNRNLPTTNWHLVSAPVSGESLDDIIANNDLASGTGGNLGLGYYFNNTTAPWIYAQSTSNIGVANGIGFSIKLANPGTLSVSGSLNTTDILKPISLGSRTNFNILGNPFTSYINSATFASTNSSILAEETLWLWDGTKYVTYNAVSPIELAPGQGFFVEASSNGNITFEATNQSHQTTDTFIKGSENSYPTFELFVERQNERRSTKVFYVDGKTTDFDNGYDSKIFSEDASDLKIYSELITNNEGKKLAIQTLPNADHATMIIPVGLVAGADQKLTFSVSSSNLPSGIEIYLEDRVSNTFVNLSEGDHTITTKADINGIGQYYIHASSAKLSNEDITQNISNVSIYKSANNEITVAGLQAKGNVKVFSLLGEELVNTDINSSGLSKIALPNLSTGVYVVKLNSILGNITKKIILE